MSLIDNKEVFSTVSFRYWASRARLIPDEKFLIENYLDKRVKTVEAGTAGGRILFEMRSLGFTSLYGFDYVPALIEAARKKDSVGSIQFEVQDAISLNYEDASFDQIVYLQQIICLIEDEQARFKALSEAYRILRPGGTALFSFLSFEARRRSAAYMPYLVYLSLLRRLNGSKRAIQYLPWLRLGGKFNWHSLLDSRPYVYWYRLEEIGRLLHEVGFQIVAIGSTHQIKQGLMHNSYQALLNEPIEGMLYVVGKK